MAKEDDRGCCKRCCINCLAMCCLFPMAWISFLVFDLGSAITGGVFQNIGVALQSGLEIAVPGVGGALGFLVNGLLGLIMILVFPIHWLLQYRPDQPMFAIAMMIPWILAGFISAMFWARDMKEGFMIGMKIAVFWMVLALIVYFLMTGFLASYLPGGTGVIDGLSQGLTDLSPTAAIIFTALEGGFIGGIFGALAGSIKYKPNTRYTPKKSKKKNKSYSAFEETTKASTGYSSTAYGAPTTDKSKCSNCGKRLDPGEHFCTNCGTKNDF